ncbi:putative holin-like toxin [Weissella paramesenteroides]
MSGYDTISLMILFGSFLLALLTYIDNHNKK